MRRLIAAVFGRPDDVPAEVKSPRLSLQSLDERFVPAVLTPTMPVTTTAVQIGVTAPKAVAVASATPARAVVATPAATLTIQPTNVKDVIGQVNKDIVAGQGKGDSILNAGHEVMSGSKWFKDYIGCVADFAAVGAAVGGTAGAATGGPAGAAAGAAGGGAFGLGFGLTYCGGDDDSDTTDSDTTSQDSTDTDTTDSDTDDELPNPDDAYGAVARGAAATPVQVTSGQLAVATKLPSAVTVTTVSVIGATATKIR